MIRSIIFDFDGLILETEEADFLSWHELFDTLGCRLRLEEWVPYIGGGEILDLYGMLERQLGKPIDRSAVQAARRKRHMQICDALQPLPGVLARIEEAQALGLSLGVASSSARAWVVPHLRRLGLARYFATVQCKDDVGVAKPDPASYQAAIKTLGVDPDQAISFEDSPHGVRAAKRAGLFCVAVPSKLTSHLVFTEADMVVPSLASVDLRQLSARLRDGVSR